VLCRQYSVSFTFAFYVLPVCYNPYCSAASVYRMLLLDVVLYAVMLWYLDQVRMSCGCGQPYTWGTFPSQGCII
jgi:hypothetical protein